MSDVVREMHTKSGLLTGLGQGVTLDEAQEIVLSYIQQHVSEPRRVPLCGNSIATDRSFIARDMSQLDAYLHYRMVDVSSIKELARRWYPRAYFASPGQAGRPPRARRHQERPGAALLPRGHLRARAGPRHGHRAGDRRPARRPAAGKPASPSGSAAPAARYRYNLLAA